jgi:antitoxin ParD1/3/4
MGMSAADDTIALTKSLKAKARKYIARGDYKDMSAMVNDAVKLLISYKSAAEPPERELKALLEKRAKGPFVSMEESGLLIETIIAKARKKHGL